MNTISFVLGIDVSKTTLDLCLIDRTGHTLQKLCINNAKEAFGGIIELIQYHNLAGSDFLICFENTGVYSKPLAQFLSKHEIAYAEIAALEIKRASGIQRGKTDPADAKQIALYGLRHFDKLQVTILESSEIQTLRVLLAQREKLLKAIALFESTQEQESFLTKEVLGKLPSYNAQTLRALNKQLKNLEAHVQQFVLHQTHLHEQQELLQTIPGIGPVTALYLVAITQGFTRFANSRKFACFAGVAPFEYRSGSSVKGKTKVSHLANKKIKSLLHMASLTAIRYDPELKLYYQRKKEEGKHSMLVLNNIKFKLIQRAFAVINRQTPYVITSKFAA